MLSPNGVGVQFSLISHPLYPPMGITRVEVSVLRMPDGLIDVDFDVHGSHAGDIWEPSQEAVFTDELWHHTCFEAFFAALDRPAYVELNFAVSGRWAAYQFEEHRRGMRRFAAANVEARTFRWSQAISISAEASLSPALPPHKEWRANFSAIIEETDGTKSYWALAHAPGPPDFHNPDCFIATLPAPSAS